MAHNVGPKNRLSRREGVDLFGKGVKLRRAQVGPGQHGPKGSKRRPSDYGIQLRQKQKTKRLYGIMERQFRAYFEKAMRVRGNTGEALLVLLETRLDNVVYRLGFTPTRAMARQLVGHGHVLVDGKSVNIPSYRVTVGQVISLTDTALAMPVVMARLEKPEFVVPQWLDRQAGTGKINALPKRSDITDDINEQLIVEFYSR